jgi:hypothetical protein
VNIQQTRPEQARCDCGEDYAPTSVRTPQQAPQDPSLSAPAFGPPPQPDPLDVLLDRVAEAVANKLEERQRIRAIAEAVIDRMDERAKQQTSPVVDSGASPVTESATEPEKEHSDVSRDGSTGC